MSVNTSAPTTVASSTESRVTASEVVGKYQHMNREEIANETPQVIGSEIVILASKLIEAGSEVIEKEAAMARKWQELRQLADTDGQADRSIKRTDEYADVQRAKCAERTVIEVMRALKQLLRMKGNEARNVY